MLHSSSLCFRLFLSFAIQMSLIFARSFLVDMQRWSKSDEEKKIIFIWLNLTIAVRVYSLHDNASLFFKSPVAWSATILLKHENAEIQLKGFKESNYGKNFMASKSISIYHYCCVIILFLFFFSLSSSDFYGLLSILNFVFFLFPSLWTLSKNFLLLIAFKQLQKNEI